jgi:hypothetical protein
MSSIFSDFPQGGKGRLKSASGSFTAPQAKNPITVNNLDFTPIAVYISFYSSSWTFFQEAFIDASGVIRRLNGFEGSNSQIDIATTGFTVAKGTFTLATNCGHSNSISVSWYAIGL